MSVCLGCREMFTSRLRYLEHCTTKRHNNITQALAHSALHDPLADSLLHGLPTTPALACCMSAEALAYGLKAGRPQPWRPLLCTPHASSSPKAKHCCQRLHVMLLSRVEVQQAL